MRDPAFFAIGHMRLRDITFTLVVATSLSACETRSKLVAKNIYSQPSGQLTRQCKNSIKTVETRQLAKNSSLALVPIAAILTGGISVMAAAAVNGGITLDDELNANRIAKNCDIEQLQTNSDILITMATKTSVSAITGSFNIVNARATNNRIAIFARHFSSPLASTFL